MLAVEHAMQLLALNIGDDFIEEHDGVVVDIFLVLSVNGLQFIHDSSQMVDELLLISTGQSV